MPLREKIKTLLQVLFSLPGEILEEVVDENIQEELQHTTPQQANETT